MDGVNITGLDTGIIIGYFIFILLFGSFFGKITKSTKDFFFSGQRFSWWVIAFSCVATVAGSYSFIKYASAGYKYGFASSMSYTNDWFFMPFLFFGWLPIIYFSRVGSIPEYFERRFDRRTRLAAMVVILLYLVGYIGYNLYTLGVAMEGLLGVNLYAAVFVIAAVCAVYVTLGGQTSVIMTDLLQGFVLLFAGLLLLYLGLDYIGGIGAFWDGLPTSHRFGLANFNTPENFNFVGVFWQDAVVGTIALYFMNQGMLMRFLSARSPREGKKAMFFVVLVLMPVAALALANAGWLGKSMESLSLLTLPEGFNSKHIFMIVANTVSQPGVFGFIVAALMAALMSTVDTYINGASAIFVNDIWKNLVAKDRDDAYYLKVARWSSVLFAVIGITLVPIFASFKSIYAAHAAFISAVTPAMIVTIFLGAFVTRFNRIAAFWTITMGTVMTMLSTTSWLSWMIVPFSHGISVEGNFKYTRALFGVVVSLVIAIVFMLLTKKDDDEKLRGLTIWSIKDAIKFFKGKEVNPNAGAKTKLMLKETDGEQKVIVSAAAVSALSLEIGDIIHVSDKRWWFGGLRSVQAQVSETNQEGEAVVYLSPDLIDSGKLTIDDTVAVELIV